MTRRLFARWTCNACKVETETFSDVQPREWVGYGFTIPGTPEGEKEVVGHLCGECIRQVNSVYETHNAKQQKA